MRIYAKTRERTKRIFPDGSSIMQLLAFATHRQGQGRSRSFGLIGPPFTAGWLERDGPILALFTGLAHCNGLSHSFAKPHEWDY